MHERIGTGIMYSCYYWKNLIHEQCTASQNNEVEAASHVLTCKPMNIFAILLRTPGLEEMNRYLVSTVSRTHA